MHPPPLALAIVGLSLFVSGARADGHDVADRVLAAVQRARQASAAPALVRRAELDAVARERAGRIAGLPHSERLRDQTPLAADLRRFGVAWYRLLATHTEMVRGYERPEEGLVSSWRSVASAWGKAIAPEYDAVGVATRRADDGWIVLVAVLLDELPAPPAPADLERAVLAEVNLERAALRLAELTPSAALAAVAWAHSRDMAERGYLSHVDPEGLGPADRVEHAGIRYTRVAENIHWSRHEPADPAEVAVQAWLASPGHRRAMLDPEARESGVGAAVGADGTIHLTQLYIAPP